ncbi:MAG TPA: hypothetical protein VFV63_02355, partial [Ilumatobacteraceae bacterium]|nr:hypothetical protein [Ilumatobacteraceae bacterium]
MVHDPGRRVDEAHDMVNRDPAKAHGIADEIATDPDVTDDVRCRALWARGMARRELHDLAGAEVDLEIAYRGAIELGEPAIAARIASTLALVIMYLGRTADALSLLDEAEHGTDGDDLGHLFMQRALIHHRLGDLDMALSGYHAALANLSEERDPVVIARVHANLGVLHAYRHEVDLAGHHTVLAIELADRLGQEMMAAGAEHNLGYAFARAGDLARALELMEAAEQRFEQIPDSKQHLAIAQSDRADVLLKANLLAEARSLADLALASISEGGNVTDAADACLLAARARLAAGDLEAARTAARQTRVWYEQHGRRPWLPLAEFVEVQADDADRLVDGLAERAEDVARKLARARWTSEAMSARVLAGRLYLERGEFVRARRVLAGAARARHVGPAGDRAAAYLATALLHEATGSRKAARRSVNEGLRTLFDNQAALGALELRAHAMAHGNELAQVGARLAIADRRPRELLSRIESARGMISLLPRAHAPDDEVLAELLAELRVVSEEIRDATGSGEPSLEPQRRRITIEDRIRRHSRRASTDGDAEE